MLRFISYDIVFQEVPNEVTLAINITGCPNRCKGCHSPHLMEESGYILDENALIGLLEKYGNSITCVCFMGGDSSPRDVNNLAAFSHKYTKGVLKTAWYSGKSQLSSECFISNFNYIKLGPYMEEFGGLDNPNTNQRFYQIVEGKMVDITHCFDKKTTFGAI